MADLAQLGGRGRHFRPETRQLVDESGRRGPGRCRSGGPDRSGPSPGDVSDCYAGGMSGEVEDSKGPRNGAALSAAAAGTLLLSWAAWAGSPGESRSDGTTIMLTGDVMLGRGVDQILSHSVDPVLYEGYVRSAEGYVELAERESGAIPRNVPPEYVWGDLPAILEEYEPAARIINLETSVTTASEPWPGKGIHYRMHPGNIGVLDAAGIDVAVLANNHVLDWGRDGLRETLRSLRDSGVTVVGAGLDDDSAFEPAVVEGSEGRVVVFAAAHGSSGVPRSWAAREGRAGVHLLPDLSADTAGELARRIVDRTVEGDRVILSIHWGGNWGYAVPEKQRRFARTLVEEGGVDVVHGHSSHHPKGLEIVRDRLVLYGAGDLLNDYEGIGGHEEYRTELALVYLPRLDGSGRLLSMILIPVRIERFRLSRATTEEAGWLRDLLERESEGLVFETGPGPVILVHPESP